MIDKAEEGRQLRVILNCLVALGHKPATAAPLLLAICALGLYEQALQREDTYFETGLKLQLSMLEGMAREMRRRNLGMGLLDKQPPPDGPVTTIFTRATVTPELANAWFQHLRNFDMMHPGCHFDVMADAPSQSMAEMVEAVRVNPALTFTQMLGRKTDA